MAAKVNEQTQSWKVIATITGESETDITEAVESYFRRYPKAGYGTYGGRAYADPATGGKTWKATIERSRSAG